MSRKFRFNHPSQILHICELIIVHKGGIALPRRENYEYETREHERCPRKALLYMALPEEEIPEQYPKEQARALDRDHVGHLCHAHGYHMGQQGDGHEHAGKHEHLCAPGRGHAHSPQPDGRIGH